jgi:hypothetical protein
MLLPGTYNAVMCRHLLDAPVDPSLADWLLQHRRGDGIFRIPGMRDADVFKKPDLEETWRYIDFHVTNYSLGAIEAIDASSQPAAASHSVMVGAGRPPATFVGPHNGVEGGPSPATADHRPVLTFAEPFLDPTFLKAWLSDRDLRDPWQEGNNIVNLGSFLLLMRGIGFGGTTKALDILFDWHDRLQEPSTGFWGVGQASDPRAALHAMAGSMHNFHLFYATKRKLPYRTRPWITL